jgi:hypothetical protein
LVLVQVADYIAFLLGVADAGAEVLELPAEELDLAIQVDLPKVVGDLLHHLRQDRQLHR